MADDTPDDLPAIEARVGYVFRDRSLFDDAMTHRSWLNENPGSSRSHNERLELLGDAVLTLVVCDHLMRRFGDRDEGQLSKMRAAIVSEVGLAEAAAAIDLGRWLHLGRGEEQAGGRSRASILANAFEALVGAIFRDGGFAAASAVVEPLLLPAVLDPEKATRRDFKSRLQERAQALCGASPEYTVVDTLGPGHDRTFQVEVSIAGRAHGRATGKSKKEAEQAAAERALEILGAAPPNGRP